jgi:dienelactone hydrolase
MMSLLKYVNTEGREMSVSNPGEWTDRREDILEKMQMVMGTLPGADKRVPLELEIHKTEKLSGLTRSRISYASEQGHRVPAYLLVPDELKSPAPALLSLHGTSGGRGRTAGVGEPYSPYSLEPAKQGYVTIAPDYVTLGDNLVDPIQMGYASGTMKAIWDHMRAVDVLESLPEVDNTSIGVIGLSLGGHNALFSAAFDNRLKAVVTSSGFDSFHDYMDGDLTGWCQDRYMPRIRDVYEKDPSKLPFDFSEVVPAVAPRSLFVHAPKSDSNFRLESVQRCVKLAGKVYDLLGTRDNLVAIYPEGKHGFPPEARHQAYVFLDRIFKHSKS